MPLRDNRQVNEAIQEFLPRHRTRPQGRQTSPNEPGVAQAIKERPEEAIQEFRRAIELDPKDAKHHINLGIAPRASSTRTTRSRSFCRAIELTATSSPTCSATPCLIGSNWTRR